MAQQDQKGLAYCAESSFPRFQYSQVLNIYLEIRYKINYFTPGTIADTSKLCLEIWGTTGGIDKESKNTSYTFHNGTVDKPQTSWNIAQQKLLVDEGHQWSSFRIGTGSVGEGSTFFIDVSSFIPY